VSLPDHVPSYLTGAERSIVVFACGDPAHAEHDSAAIAACRELPPEALARADVRLVGPLRPEWLRDIAAGTRVIIADTVLGSGGQVVEVPLVEMSGREAPIEATSTPGTPLDEVVAMAQLLRDEPLGGRFVGLGVEAPPADVEQPVPAADLESLRAAVARAIADLDRD
jgi:hypothetical protein